ncbi:MAG: calcium-binding protein [Burkholderiales bacterium]|nr:calcium-binding protein [Burkholderiales bacterium]
MSFHLYLINEVFSNADGTVQFIELKVGNHNGESLWRGHTLSVVQGNTVHSFTFPQNLPSSATANTSVLVATQGFANLGLVTPDFIVPDGFLFTSGAATVNFAEVDELFYSALPTDGTLSLSRTLSTGTNSPTNFAGKTGTVVLAPPPPPPPPPITGTSGPDTLQGTDAGERIEGLAGNDTLAGGAGDDTLDGGAGLDTATFAARRAEVTLGAGGRSVTGPQGTDSLTGIERLHFADQSVAYDLEAAAGHTARLLGALLGVAAVHNPVYVGLGLALFDQGLSREAVAAQAIGAVLGPAPDNAALVQQVYTSIVGAPADAGTVAGLAALVSSGQFTQVSLTLFAADLQQNAEHIGLAGLADSGLAYLPAVLG